MCRGSFTRDKGINRSVWLKCRITPEGSHVLLCTACGGLQDQKPENNALDYQVPPLGIAYVSHGVLCAVAAGFMY